MNIDYSEKIPNNVELASNRTLQRALEHWQPEFQHWWADMGPEGTSAADVYLRTAISVEPKGWAHFDYVKMPDYRWGIFLAPAEAGRQVNFGAHKGEPAWQEVPGEYRSNLRCCSTEAGSVSPALLFTICAISSRSMSRKAVTCGRWCTCSRRTSAATAARKPRRCSNGARAMPTIRASSVPSTRRHPTGSPFSCS